MELRKTLLRAFNILFPFEDFTYILQQEEYSLQRISFWFPKFFFKRNFQKRGKLVYTQRAKLIIFLSITIFLIALSCLWDEKFLNITTFVVLLFLLPLIVILSNIIISPVYFFIRRKLINKSKIYFDKNKGDIKVIAITGSFGKTTLKNFLEQFLKYNYRTQMIPGNINSTIGIANWILNDFEPGTKVLITELDSYKMGRIKKSTKFLNPDISIVTNIGDQHLQRYKNKKNLAKSLYELFENSNNKTYKLTTEETYKYLRDNDFGVQGVNTAELESNNNFSDSNNINLSLAKNIAKLLHVSDEHIDYITEGLKLPDRRQITKELFGFQGIDDSYNISVTSGMAGVIEAKKQALKHDKKLLVITAGIPELGPHELDGNVRHGELLEKHCDQVFILNSIFRDDLYSGIKEKKKIKLFKTFSDSIDYLKNNYTPKDWFLLIEPELTDLYY